MSFISPCLQPNGKHCQSGLGLCLHLGEGLQQVGLGAVEIKNLIICSKLGHHSLISAGLFFESALFNISIVAFDSKFFLLKTSCRLFLIKMSLSLSQIWSQRKFGLRLQQWHSVWNLIMEDFCHTMHRRRIFVVVSKMKASSIWNKKWLPKKWAILVATKISFTYLLCRGISSLRF